MKLKKLILLLSLLVLFILLPLKTQAKEPVCATYLTQVGCTHCAKTDPVVLSKVFEKHSNFYVIEYEIFKDKVNAQFIMDYHENYSTPLGVPTLIFGKDDFLVGDRSILGDLDQSINQKTGNKCPLKSGEMVSLNKLNFNLLAGKPKIWHNNKILIKQGGGADNNLLHRLLTTNNPEKLVKENGFNLTKTKKIALSGQSIEFDKAADVNGWLYQWKISNATPKGPLGQGSIINLNQGNSESQNQKKQAEKQKTLTIAKVLSLGAVDAVNPCALAVLILMMITIVTYNAKDKKKLLLAGLGFILAVFITYIIYGLIIVKFFQVVQALASIKIWLYRILGIIAIILGILNIKDFFNYTPGSFGTEMPMFLRPKVKKVISKATSPLGAMGVGFFVTVFLLPCTIGPYVIAGGILSVLEMVEVIPWLLLYNLIFVAPMLVIVFLIYGGMSKIKDLQKWKDENIKYLHLIAGSIMALLGIAMILGLV